MKRLQLIVAPFAFVVLCGCGTGVYPVEGQVVWKDGKPATELKNGIVIFDLPEKKVGARGNIRDDGSFTLTTNTPGDGAFPGEYKVLVVEVGRKALGGPDGSQMAPGAMDSKYSDPSTTTLSAKVEAKTNKITLSVERAAP